MIQGIGSPPVPGDFAALVRLEPLDGRCGGHNSSVQGDRRDGTRAPRSFGLAVAATLLAVPLAFLYVIPVGGAAARAVDEGACPTWVPALPSAATTATVPVATSSTIAVDSAALGATSASITASTTGAADNVQETIQYWAIGAEPVCTSVQRAENATATLTLSGLHPATRYRFYVVANVGAGAVAKKAGTFVTLAAGIVAEGVTVGDVSVGRLTRAAALTALNRSVGKPVHLGYAGAVWQVLPSSLGAHVDVAQAVSTALEATPGQKLPALTVSIDGAALQHYVSSLAQRWGHKANEDSVRLVGTHAVVKPASAGVTVDTTQLAQELRTELLNGTRTLLELPVKRVAVSASTPQKVVVVRRSSQTLTAYLNGKVVLTTPVTTGRPALPTPIGSFSVLNRNSPYVFHSPWPPGSPYYYPPTPVTWAMEFYDGDFLHDDPGEPADAFGSDSQNGYFASHGCVHVPHDVMAFLYNWLPVGAPVIVSDT